MSLNWSHSQNLTWFQTTFRPQFELMVVKPAEHMVHNSETKMPAFVWLSCAIDWLAGLRFGESTEAKGKTPGRSKKAYTEFIDEFFPSNKYVANELWDSLRNGLVHMYTIKGKKYALADSHPEWHLKNTTDGHQLLNLEDFYSDFVEAKDKFFAAVESDPQRLVKVVQRYERDHFLGIIPIVIA